MVSLYMYAKKKMPGIEPVQTMAYSNIFTLNQNSQCYQWKYNSLNEQQHVTKWLQNLVFVRRIKPN